MMQNAEKKQNQPTNERMAERIEWVSEWVKEKLKHNAEPQHMNNLIW